MDLLMAIKEFYDILLKHKIIQTKPKYEEIEKIADEVYDNDYKNLQKYLIVTLEPTIYNNLKNKLQEIKNIVKKEHE